MKTVTKLLLCYSIVSYVIHSLCNTTIFRF
nr:MAG TPA: hypothetical protein [Caudoviricetes sp.]